MQKLNIDLFKIAVPLFIVMGMVKLIVYYHHFNIQILDYLEFSEIITAFLSDLFIYLMILFPIPFILIALDETSKVMVVVYILCIIGIIIFFLWKFPIAIADFPFISVFSCIILAIVLLAGSSVLIEKKENNNLDDSQIIKFSLLIIIFLIALFTLVSTIADNIAMNVLNKNLYLGTTIVTNGKTYISDSSITYIGKTNHYIFFFDKTEQSALIFPSDKAESFKLKITNPLPKSIKNDRPEQAPANP